jgi:predicted nucleic acid-binding protein
VLVVSDTSPLRALQAIEHINLLEWMYPRVLVPPAVLDELRIDVPGLGPFPVGAHPFMVCQAPRDISRVNGIEARLNRGEAEALVLALEVNAQYVLIDESLGRRVAASLGLRTVGVLALLVQAKQLGHIAAVAPQIDALARRINFRVSPQLRARVLQDAGELPE